MATKTPPPLTGAEIAQLLTLIKQNSPALPTLKINLKEVNPMNWEIEDDAGF